MAMGSNMLRKAVRAAEIVTMKPDTNCASASAVPIARVEAKMALRLLRDMQRADASYL